MCAVKLMEVLIKINFVLLDMWKTIFKFLTSKKPRKADLTAQGLQNTREACTIKTFKSGEGEVC